MPSIFSKLPNNLIIKIVQIENDRKIEELMVKRKYNEVIKQLNKLSTYSVCAFQSTGQKMCFYARHSVLWVAVKQELLFDDTADLPW